jgi:hypothetical protein
VTQLGKWLVLTIVLAGVWVAPAGFERWGYAHQCETDWQYRDASRRAELPEAPDSWWVDPKDKDPWMRQCVAQYVQSAANQRAERRHRVVDPENNIEQQGFDIRGLTMGLRGIGLIVGGVVALGFLESDLRSASERRAIRRSETAA